MRFDIAAKELFRYRLNRSLNTIKKRSLYLFAAAHSRQVDSFESVT